jgi:hypothetical protein
MTFITPETSLSVRLGLNRDRLRELRLTQLVKGVDWDEGQRHQVLYSVLGEQKLTQWLNVQSKSTPPIPLSASGPSTGSDTRLNTSPRKPQEAQEGEKRAGPHLNGDPEFETMSVASVSRPALGGRHFPNPRIIRAERKTGEMVNVAVKDSKNFRARMANGQPMVLRARMEAGQWTLAQPCPRWPGKW